MLLIRRSWLLPIIVIIAILYYLSYSSLRDNAIRNSYNEDVAVPIDSLPKDAVRLKKQSPKYPISSFIPLPSGKSKKIPQIQFKFDRKAESAEAEAVRKQRQAVVKDSFEHAWSGYKSHALGKDEVRPISGGHRNSFGGWGATMVDTMDALWMLGMKEDFEMCVALVKKIDFTTCTEDSINVFETTIRYLGGLLGAYDISNGKYPTLLEKAQELGELLYMIFDTPNHMPITRWDWKSTAVGKPLVIPSSVLLAELGSLSVELTRLSQLTRDPKYFDAVQRITQMLSQTQNTTKIPGLWPTFIAPHDSDFTHNHFTLGGMADSTYEYLPKEYLLLGGLDDNYRVMYESAIEAAEKHIFYRPMLPKNEDILISGNAIVNNKKDISTETQGQHLGCFTGGMVGMGAKIFDRPSDLAVARKLTEGCVWAYDSMPTGLMPESFHIVPCHIGVDPQSNAGNKEADTQCIWDDEKWYRAVAALQAPDDNTATISEVEAGKYYVKQRQLTKGYLELPDNRYVLRPEAIESVFILYRITGDVSLLETAWRMFQNIEKYTRTEIAHAGIYDVRQKDSAKSDRMESFWLAETLKYFWLIFADPDVLSLDEWVLNTEAHPFRRPRAGETFG